jgi:hypothetical protein
MVSERLTEKPLGHAAVQHCTGSVFAKKVVKKELSLFYLRELHSNLLSPAPISSRRWSGPGFFLAKARRGRNIRHVFHKACGMVRAAKASSIESLPLFATDDVIGAALPGGDRVQEWRQIASSLKRAACPRSIS